MSLAGLLLRGFGGTGTRPDAPILSVVDNADGTATATVSDSTPGSANVVLTIAVDSDFVAGIWISGGSCVGDDAVVLTLDDGLYWARVESTLNRQTVVSAPCYFRVSSTSQAVYQAVLQSIQAKIIALGLSISAENVVVGKVANDRNHSKPCILISPYRREELKAAAGTNLRDDIGYQIQISILDADNRDPSANLNTYLLWREQIRRAFHNSRLAGVGSVYSTQVMPLQVVDADAWFQRNQFVSGLVVHCISRETRS